MSIFCLVHGSTQNAQCWELLIPELEKRGHSTITVALPTDELSASATHYADVIVQALEDIDDDVVVVGHSVSGLFIPLVAQERPVPHLVFLVAIIPKVGTSFLAQVNADPDMFNPAWLALGSQGKDPLQDEEAIAMEFLFHDCTPEVARWALTTRILMYARGAMTEVFPLQTWPDITSSYILCTEDRTINPAWFRPAARELLGVDAVELPGGHCPYLSRPAHLAEVLLQALVTY